MPRGTSQQFLELVREHAVPVYEKYRWELAGAWETVGVDESEAILLWAIPTWEDWAEFEKNQRQDKAIMDWRGDIRKVTDTWYRFLLADAPLSPFRIGRQPSRADRTEEWPD